MSMGDIELHIEELVLHGFAPEDGARIGQEVERELAHLLAEGGPPTALTEGGDMAHIDGGIFDLASDTAAKAVGAKVARAVYGGLKR